MRVKNFFYVAVCTYSYCITVQYREHVIFSDIAIFTISMFLSFYQSWLLLQRFYFCSCLFEFYLGFFLAAYFTLSVIAMKSYALNFVAES